MEPNETIPEEKPSGGDAGYVVVCGNPVDGLSFFHVDFAEEVSSDDMRRRGVEEWWIAPLNGL
jgi:hypothetical protein